MITAGLEPFALRLAKRIQQETDIAVIYADCHDIPRVLLQGGKYKFIPYGVAPTFAHEILSLCLDENIDYLLPLRRTEMQALAESKQLFAEYGITLLVPAKGLLNEVSFLDNPDKALPVEILLNGKNFFNNEVYSELIAYSGPFVISDSGEEALLVGLL